MLVAVVVALKVVLLEQAALEVVLTAGLETHLLMVERELLILAVVEAALQIAQQAAQAVQASFSSNTLPNPICKSSKQTGHGLARQESRRWSTS
jgi:hypothetical protein